MNALTRGQIEELLAAGADGGKLESLSESLLAFDFSHPARASSMTADSFQAQKVYRAAASVVENWSSKLNRTPAQNKGADLIQRILRDARNAFCRAYVDVIFNRISRGYTRSVRAEKLVDEAADLCPGLCPTREELLAEAQRPLAQKEGVEIAQADFLSHVFSHRTAGPYLIHCMLQPLPQSRELLGKFQKDGVLDLGTARVERRGSLGCILYSNLRFLNAEDNTTLIPLEVAADLVLLDKETEAGLLRGNVVEHPRYRGRRVFSSGLNLTHLYHGKIPMMFFITRELGFVNKIYRGLAAPVFDPDGPQETLEKSWIGALETFAIGGGCQVLLVVDYVIAEEGSYFNLPARKEGIIPGVAPLRFSRFMGERTARQGILFDRSFPVSKPEARGLVNEVVPAGRMDAAIDRVAANAGGGGLVSTGANRKAIRLASEPLDLFREYMALYCREQASCIFSPALTENLERNWKAASRRLD